jgi:hypothetical protein
MTSFSWRFILLEKIRGFHFPVISGVSGISCHLTVGHCQVGPSPNPENLKMLALRHFGICGNFAEICGIFAGNFHEQLNPQTLKSTLDIQLPFQNKEF